MFTGKTLLITGGTGAFGRAVLLFLHYIQRELENFKIALKYRINYART